jgi:transmembrane sensor
MGDMENKPTEILINQAAQWYARLHASDCSAAERSAFKAWLAGDPRREQAYKSVIDAASLISDQLGSDPRMRSLVSSALVKPQEVLAETAGEIPTTSSFARHAGASASFRYSAALVICFGVVAFFTFAGGQHVDVSPSEIYANNSLDKQRIELNDGSVVYLDVGAKLTVSMNQHERRLGLDTGRALFEVAHDKSRPFSVSTSGTSVVALGTRFQVEAVPQSQSINVTLLEGSVAVSNSNSANSWREVLRPGQQLLIDNLLHRHQIAAVNTQATTSWSTGFLVFDKMPLRAALDEINRYAKVKVVLGDSSLADIPIAGNFLAGGDSSEFVETLTAVLPLRSARTGANEIVLFEKYDIQTP